MIEHFAALLAALQVRDRLTNQEIDAIEQLPYSVREFRKGMSLIEQDSRPTESCLLLQGLAARVVYTPSGKRNITAVHIAGDFVDLHGFLLKVMDHHVAALTGVTAAFVPHAALRDISESFPHLARMLWLLTTIDAAIHRAWLTCLGRKSPLQHLAHLFCELSLRNKNVGLAPKLRFEFDVTQTEVSDMLGLSLVHTNRTIQELRASGLIRWDGKHAEIVDAKRLAKIADFDPTYLNLWSEPR